MSENQIAEQPADKRPLDDLMLAMDVVDTLRHRASLVERELHAEERDQQLMDRLREIYAAQGIEVPEHVLAEGVAALKEGRFTYAPPELGMATTLAKVYVNRHRWMSRLLMLFGLVGVAWLGYMLLVSAPRERLLREIPRQITVQEKTISDISHVAEAKERAQQLASSAQRVLSEGDTAAAQQVLERLQDLRSQLEQEYELRIVSEGSTGVWRIPDVNAAARNYYIIVQAVKADGQVLTLPITNEENGQTYQVSKWGLRVDEDTFYQVAADKKDDGIIQRNRFGVKKAGYLEPEYLLPTTGRAITSW
jgi:hypothetical protein